VGQSLGGTEQRVFVNEVKLRVEGCGVIVKDGEKEFVAKGSTGNNPTAAMEIGWRARAGWREMRLRVHGVSRVVLAENSAAKLLDVLRTVWRQFSSSPASKERDPRSLK